MKFLNPNPFPGGGFGSTAPGAGRLFRVGVDQFGWVMIRGNPVLYTCTVNRAIREGRRGTRTS